MHNKLALVLGGGGAAGNAWMIGIVAGLFDAGVDMTEADLVIGTSSGATAAAHVRSGRTPAELYASILAEPSLPPANRPSQAPQMNPIFDRLRAIGAEATSAEDLRQKMGAFGLECDTKIPPEAVAQRRALVASRLPGQDWPEKPVMIVAVDAHTGDAVTFDRDSGALLADAVTASTALPGGPTHPIGDRRYVSGGVRSADNADLAMGYSDVVVLTPFSERKGPLPPGQFEGIRRFPGYDLAAQIEALRSQGAQVTVISPDDASRDAMGVNQMDPATRRPSALAGFAQGQREAARLISSAPRP